MRDVILDDKMFTKFYNEKKFKDMCNMINNYIQDKEKDERLRQHQCKTCFYLESNKVCLDVISTYHCKKCGETSFYGNSNCPNYCQECVEKYNICCFCGEEL